MSHLDLFVSQSNVFGGLQRLLRRADYAVLGVPFDVTSTYRSGARFGPNAIRQASLNIETYSFRAGMDFEDLSLHDLGDLHISNQTERTLERTAMVVEELLEAGKTPVVLGGEHTITLGVMEGLGKRASKTALVSFDAHLDLRDEFLDLKLSHTTFMRRINEEVKPAGIIEVGTRAVCKEELAYARRAKVAFIRAQQIAEEGTKRISERLREKLAGYKNVYLSIDIDVLDPAYAPAAQNPEAEGLDMYALLDILCTVCDERVVGFDVVEVAPNYDQGITAIQAAKTIFEVLCCLEKSRKRRRR